MNEDAEAWVVQYRVPLGPHSRWVTHQDYRTLEAAKRESTKQRQREARLKVPGPRAEYRVLHVTQEVVY